MMITQTRDRFSDDRPLVVDSILVDVNVLLS